MTHWVTVVMISNGSTFQMIPIIFEPDRAGLLGSTSAIAGYGAFIIPQAIARSHQSWSS